MPSSCGRTRNGSGAVGPMNESTQAATGWSLSTGERPSMELPLGERASAMDIEERTGDELEEANTHE